MEPLLTTSNIMFIFGILGVLFSIYSYFRNPQIELDKQVAIDREEVEGKAGLLAQQVQWEKEANEKRFTEFGLRLDGAMTLAQNHIHTVDTKVDRLIESVGVLSNKITELSTIINERNPRK